MIRMHQILALIVLLSSFQASTQARHLSSRARELTQALAALRTRPEDSGAQERYLKTFPHHYTEFLNLFDLNREL